MHAGVARCVVDEHLSVFVSDPSVREEDVHHVADVLLTLRHHEESCRICNHLCRILEGCHVHVEDIAEAGSTAAYAVGEMEPALVGLYRMRTFAVLHFLDGVVEPLVDDILLGNDGMLHAIYKGPADSAAAARIDESVLRTCIKGILAVHELRVENDVALLRLRLEIRKALPVHEVLGTCDAGCSNSRRKISRWSIRILALYAEDAVDPSVLMGGQTHVVYVCRRLAIFRHSDRTVPETEIVHTVRTFCHSKERLAVSTLDTHHENILSVPLDRTRIECGMDAETLHEVRIRLLVHVIPPEQRSMVSGKDRESVALIDAVSLDSFILSGNEGLVLCLKPLKSFFKSHDYRIN